MAPNIQDFEAERLADELDAIAKHCAALPVRDARSADDILGYDAGTDVDPPVRDRQR